MTGTNTKRLACVVAILWALDSAGGLRAQLSIGTWVKQDSSTNGGGLTMTVEACCNGGRRLVYRITGNADILMTVDSPFDGTDVPVLVGGKPSGETMAIKRVDDYHVTAVVKMNGQPFGTSKATLSPDGKTLTVESVVTAAAMGQTVGKQTEVWLRK